MRDAVLLRFNSIKVRLRRCLTPCFCLLQLFQFHKGTIKTVRSMRPGRSPRSFNSIKVRLRPVRLSGDGSTSLCFNSIKVRLRHFEFDHDLKKCSSFNSIKVRLRPGVCPHLGNFCGFQFHKGTIKTHIDMLDKSPCYRGFPNAKIRKKTGEICRCGIILK